MNRALGIATLVATLCSVPRLGVALSAVFAGDPVNPATGQPYEILPGSPLVLPGPDGVVGTPDDVVNPSVIGDIDLVVRSGSLSATDAIPPPTALSARAALPIGVAGSAAAGGIEIPFTVFLSDGATSASAPYGHVLAAADMDGIPVVVAAFADLDGDGFIGPTNGDRTGTSDNSREVRELEAVGRAVAVFSGGVAHGSVAVRAGRPAGRGGLKVALTAMALTSPFDPNFMGGNIPSGPAISTALPFFPERDLTKLIRDRPVPASPTSTLQQVIRFAVLPNPNATTRFTLPLDGSSPTIDAAVVNSQSAARVAFREYMDTPVLSPTNGPLRLGTVAPASFERCHLVPVDRWDNPTDPPPDFIVSVHATPPVQVVHPRRSNTNIKLRTALGATVVFRVPPGTPDGTSGTLTAERDGVVVASLPYRVSAEANRAPADTIVPSLASPTIQAAIDNVSDRNGDGKLVISIRPGIYRENLVVGRSVELRGEDTGTTFVQGDGTVSVISIAAPNVLARGLTAIGGTTGFSVGSTTTLAADRAWRNLAAGITLGASSQLRQSAASENGGDGIVINGASGAVCFENEAIDNAGAGVNASAVQGVQIVGNHLAGNLVAGIALATTTNSVVTGNRSVLNFGSGIQLGGGETGAGGTASGRSGGLPQNNQLTNNLSAGNDGDGLNMDSTDSNLVSGNALDMNKGYGLFLRRSTNDDFAVAPGVQAPLGDNAASDNRQGDLLIRTN